MKSKVWMYVVGVVAIVGAFVLGQSYGASTVVPVEKTVTVTNTVTPVSCIAALDDADEVMTTLADGMDLSSQALLVVPDAMNAVYYNNPDELSRITDKMEEVTKKLNMLSTDLVSQKESYDANAERCRAEA